MTRKGSLSHAKWLLLSLLLLAIPVQTVVRAE